MKSTTTIPAVQQPDVKGTTVEIATPCLNPGQARG
jgi:hypothetical protein